MGKNIILIFAITFTLFSFNSCIKKTYTKKQTENIDFQLFSKPVKVSKLYAEIRKKVGSNAQKTEKIELTIYRPSVEGIIFKKQNNPDNLNIEICYQAPTEKYRIEIINFHSNTGGWCSPIIKGIDIGGFDNHNLYLCNSLFDLNQLSDNNLNKAIQETLNKYKNTQKFTYQYIRHIEITNNNIEICFRGKTKKSREIKDFYFKTDFQGNPK